MVCCPQTVREEGRAGNTMKKEEMEDEEVQKRVPVSSTSVRGGFDEEEIKSVTRETNKEVDYNVGLSKDEDEFPVYGDGPQASEEFP